MHNDLLTIGKFTLHGYSVMIAIGFLVAMGLCLWRAKKENKNSDIITDYAMIAVICGFLGGKILYLIVNFKVLLANPKSMLGIPQVFSGFVVYGGIIGGAVALLIYSKIKKADFLEYMDFMLPYIAIVQGFGRIGCFLAGCCYGAPTDSFLGVVFPQGSIAPPGIKLWPTQLFSSAGDFVIAAILIALSYKIKKKGNITALYIILYSIGRFAVEFFRADARGGVGPFSTSQFISLILLPVAIAFIIFINKDVLFKSKESKENKEQ